MSKNWTAADMPDQSGKTAVVTGANSGVGREAAFALARSGAHVVFACRSLDRARAAVAELRAGSPDVSAEILLLDLADPQSVSEFAADFAAAHDSLDILINNAGIMAIPYRQAPSGYEMQFATNHLGHFALTGLLLDPLLAAAGARVVAISSNLHRAGRINYDDLQGETGYDRRRAYSQSKLANLLFAYELQRRLAAVGSAAISVGAHPGYAATNLQFAGPDMDGSSLQHGLMTLSNRLIAQSSEMGALPLLYAATAPDVVGCDYIGPSGFMAMRGYPAKERSSSASYDEAAARRLWDISVELTGVSYPELNR